MEFTAWITLLQLERDGVIILERDLGKADLIASVDTAICIWDAAVWETVGTAKGEQDQQDAFLALVRTAAGMDAADCLTRDDLLYSTGGWPLLMATAGWIEVLATDTYVVHQHIMCWKQHWRTKKPIVLNLHPIQFHSTHHVHHHVPDIQTPIDALPMAWRVLT